MILALRSGGLSFHFLFFKIFFFPRLTRYTDAPRIQPSAKCANGVPIAAKIMGMDLRSFLGLAYTLHDTQDRQCHNKSQQCPLHLPHLLHLAVECTGLHSQSLHGLHRRQLSLAPQSHDLSELRMADWLAALIGSIGFGNVNALPLAL